MGVTKRAHGHSGGDWWDHQKLKLSPGRTGSGDRVSTCEPKGPRFDSSQGKYVPWLQLLPTRALVKACFSHTGVSCYLSLSLPLSLKSWGNILG